MTASNVSVGQSSKPCRGNDFTELSRWVRREGLLRRRYGYYAARIAINVLVLGAGAVVFVLLGDSWWQLLTAVLLAGVFTQFAFHRP